MTYATLWKVSAPVPLLTPPPKQERTLVSSPELDHLRSALNAIPNDTDSLDYDLWRNIGFAIHYATEGSDEGLALFHEFSARSAKYDPEFIDNRFWPYAGVSSSDPITERTLFAIAAQRGWVDPAIADDFDVVPPPTPQPRNTSRFKFIPASEFSAGKPPAWIIKGVLPRAALVVLYGESGAGKSFMALDIMGAVARGVDWRGHRTVAPLKCGYIAAEGAAGFRNRIQAYASHNGIDVAHLPLSVLTGAPNFLERDDILDLGQAMIEHGQLDLLVVDTLAQVTPGANENSSEDMGRAVKHCMTLHEVTGATVVLVHHSGKDASRGARGWSGIKGALDCELEVTRCDNDRMLTITKLKDGAGEGSQFGFRLLDVPLGMDDDGDVYGSCVVDHTDKVTIGRKDGPRGKNEQVVYKALLDAIETGVDRVDEKVVIEAYQSVVADTRRSKEDRDLRPQTVKRTLKELERKGFVVKFGNDWGLPKGALDENDDSQ